MLDDGLAQLQSAIENLQLEILLGVLAQLVERLNGIEEVTGSNPVGSSPSVGQVPIARTIFMTDL